MVVEETKADRASNAGGAAGEGGQRTTDGEEMAHESAGAANAQPRLTGDGITIGGWTLRAELAFWAVGEWRVQGGRRRFLHVTTHEFLGDAVNKLIRRCLRTRMAAGEFTDLQAFSDAVHQMHRDTIRVFGDVVRKELFR